MKKFLFILAIISGIFFLKQNKEADFSMIEKCIASQENLQIDKNEMSDREQQIFIISKEMKSNNCLTPRRTATTVSNIIHLRSAKTLHKLTEHFRIKGVNLLKTISEKVRSSQTINFTSLLFHNGYLVFGLRKLII